MMWYCKEKQGYCDHMDCDKCKYSQMEETVKNDNKN